MQERFRWQGKEVGLELSGAGEVSVARREGREVALRTIAVEEGALVLELDGRKRRVAFARDGADLLLALDGIAYRLERVGPLVAAGSHPPHEQPLEAPMPGLVRLVNVAAGEKVTRGQTLVVLEAMKMEIRITAPEAARVSAVRCAPGEQVDRGQTLIDLDSMGEGA